MEGADGLSRRSAWTKEDVDLSVFAPEGLRRDTLVRAVRRELLACGRIPAVGE